MSEKRPQMPHEHHPLDANTEEVVQERAREIAKTEGRDTVNEADLAEARRELRKEERPPAADLPSGKIPLTEDSGVRDPAEPAAENNPPPKAPADENERMSDHVRKGLEEADHEQRLSARESDDPNRSV